MKDFESRCVRAMGNLREEADFLERSCESCVQRYAYGPSVRAMKEGAAVIQELLNRERRV